MKKIILSIDGMTCSACSNGLEKYLNKQEGIQEAVVNLVLATATIQYDEEKLNIPAIEEFVKKAGFKSLGEFKKISTQNKSKKEKVVWIVYTLLAIFLIYVSMGHSIAMPPIPFLNREQYPINYILCLWIIATLFLGYGWDILKNGYKNLIHKTPNMDTLVGIGVLVSYLYSVYMAYGILKGNTKFITNLYFESSCIIIYFVKLGRYLDGLSKNKTKEAIQQLVTITPDNAVIKVGDTYQTVTLDAIQKGDIVVCKPGEKIAVDGEIILGKAHVDESFMTGESKPVSKTIGSKVMAGSMNYDGYMEYRAEKIGKESTVSEIVRLVVEATNTKAPIAKTADTVSSYFVPIIMLIAFVTFLVYLALGQSIGSAFTTFVTILVVACPCSLGLATPLAMIVSEGLCASHGILIKKSEILENAQKVNTVVLDKTGTLTYGKLQIEEIINYSGKNKEEILQIVGSIEAKATHPIAEVFVAYLKEHDVSMLPVENFKNIEGMGITAEINHEKIMIGNDKILNKFGIANPPLEDANALAQKGSSLVYVAKEKEVMALIGVNDTLRKEAPKVMEVLRKRHIEAIMITGDNEETAGHIAEKVGISKVFANVLPKEKVEMIQKIKRENKMVMMCGDGINDSPALASADIGVSVQTGTEIAMDSSDVILTKSNLKSILHLMQISQSTIKIIKQNLFWAFFYNSLMIPIAMGLLKPIGIMIEPMLASLAMVFSSLTVIGNTLRLKKIKIEKEG